MGLVATAVNRLRERRALDLPRALEGLGSVGGTSVPGVAISPRTALNSATVYGCVRVLSESVAQIRWHLYERLADGGRERARAHPLYELLHDQPNPLMSAFTLREVLMVHLLLWGNGFVEIEWSRSGQVVGLWPLRPDRMTVRTVNNALVYDYDTVADGVHRLPAYRVLHVPGLSFDGLVGYSPVKLQMESIGLEMAGQEFGGRFYSNGAKPSVVLTHPGQLSKEAKGRLRDSWADAHQGLSNAHRVAVLEEGMGIETLGIPPEEAQFLQTRQFQKAEICGWYRVPPHMVADLSRSTNNNIEHQSLEFTTFSLGPWLERLEQATRKDLLIGEERQRYYSAFMVDSLLMGDSVSRWTTHQTAIMSGVKTINEVRAQENMNPVPGGDVLLLPLNMTPVPVRSGKRGQVARGRWQGERRAATDEEIGDLLAERQGLAGSQLPLFEQAAGRVVRREVADVRRAVNKHLRKRGLEDFRQWLREFYDGFEDVLAGEFAPLLEAMAALVARSVGAELERDVEVDEALREFIQSYLETFGNRHAASSRQQLEALLDEPGEEDPADLIDERLAGWEETRPQRVAREQVFEALNALAVAAYAGAGVAYLRWVASGKSCAFCRDLDGRVVAISGFFVKEGATIDGEDGKVFKVSGNRRHGPLHDGCDCVTVAG